MNLIGSKRFKLLHLTKGSGITKSQRIAKFTPIWIDDKTSDDELKTFLKVMIEWKNNAKPLIINESNMVTKRHQKKHMLNYQFQLFQYRHYWIIALILKYVLQKKHMLTHQLQLCLFLYLFDAIKKFVYEKY